MTNTNQRAIDLVSMGIVGKLETKHTPLQDDEWFVCLDCGVSRIKYLWSHVNHDLRILRDEE